MSENAKLQLSQRPREGQADPNFASPDDTAGSHSVSDAVVPTRGTPGAMRKPGKRARTSVLSIRLTAVETSTLDRRRAAAGGMKASAYARAVLFSREKKIPHLAVRLHSIITRLADVTPHLGCDRAEAEALGNELRLMYIDALRHVRLAE